MKNYINDLIDIHIYGQLELYVADIVKKDNYNIILSDLIDDQYWNYAYLKNNIINLNIEDLNSFKQYKSKIEFRVSRVNETLKSKFIQAIMDGFSGENPDDPYESLSDGYREALDKSIDKSNSKYKVINYVGLCNEEAISTATVLYKDNNAIIYNVTTNKNYQKQGVCKQTMSEIINDLRKIGIETVCVLTEQGFYTEQVYKNMGFKEIMLGKAYKEYI